MVPVWGRFLASEVPGGTQRNRGGGLWVRDVPTSPAEASLLSQVSLRKQEIADRLNAWVIFHQKNKELCDWLTQMENKAELSSDLNIEEMVEKLKKVKTSPASPIRPLQRSSRTFSLCRCLWDCPWFWSRLRPLEVPLGS